MIEIILVSTAALVLALYLYVETKRSETASIRQGQGQAHKRQVEAFNRRLSHIPSNEMVNYVTPLNHVSGDLILYFDYIIDNFDKFTYEELCDLMTHVPSIGMHWDQISDELELRVKTLGEIPHSTHRFNIEDDKRIQDDISVRLEALSDVEIEKLLSMPSYSQLLEMQEERKEKRKAAYMRKHNVK